MDDRTVVIKNNIEVSAYCEIVVVFYAARNGRMVVVLTFLIKKIREYQIIEWFI